MDPLGFGLENFDAVGAWRTKDGKFNVDSSGTLPDGRSFNGAVELKGLLVGSCILNNYLGAAVRRKDHGPASRLQPGDGVARAPFEVGHGMNVFTEMNHVSAPT